MLDSPFTPWPSYTPEEAKAVSNVILSNRVSYWTGMECKHFEQEFSDYIGTTHAIALANGTLALEGAMLALNVSNGDEVIVSPRSFMASASCVITAGATPVFADVDRDTQNISAETIQKVLTNKTKAIIVVHLAGMPADMDPIMDLAEQHKLYVVEDCAQAHGARYKGKSVGSIGHIGVWSFCQDKIITTGGEGGMITTNSSDIKKIIWSYKDHGKSWDAMQRKDHAPGYRWLHESIGSNWRMTEMQAAIGRIQIKMMPVWHSARTHNCQKILNTCRALSGLRVPECPSHSIHAAYKCYVFIDRHALVQDWNRDRVVSEIAENGVPCQTGSCPELYREKAFTRLKLAPKNRLPMAKELGETSLMFLVHPTLTTAEIEKTCRTIQSVLHRATE